MTVYDAKGLDPTKNPSPYGALSEPDPATVKELLAESAQIHALLKTSWRPTVLSGVEGEKDAEEQRHTGAMVALYPDPDAAEDLALAQAEGTEVPEDLHITLAFMGKAAEIPDHDRLRAMIALFAAHHPAITGRISGVGKFVAEDKTKGGDAVYWSFDSAQLPAFRQELVELLASVDAPANTEHGFAPHMTVGYDIAAPDYAPAMTLAFPALSLVLAGERWDFSFGRTEPPATG